MKRQKERNTIHPPEWLNFKRQTKPSVEKDTEQLESSHTSGRNVKWYNHV